MALANKTLGHTSFRYTTSILAANQLYFGNPFSTDAEMRALSPRCFFQQRSAYPLPRRSCGRLGEVFLLSARKQASPEDSQRQES